MAINDNNYQAMDPPAPKENKSWARKVLTSLTFWIIVVRPHVSEKAAPMKNLFLRTIQFIVFPLVFSSLVIGIADQKDMKQLGRLAIKSIIYFEVITTIALIIGLLAVNIAKPGKVGISEGDAYDDESSTTFTFEIWIEHLTPKTWGEMMGGSGSSELLQVLVAAVLTGVATSKLREEHKRLIIDFARAILEMMFKFVDIIIWTAPIGVCFAIADAIGSNGLSALGSLGALVGTVYVTIAIFILVIFGGVCLLFKISPVEFLIAMKEPLIIAYTTATSEAALPKVFDALEKYGSVGEQIVMVLMLMISSKGVAGVRSASIIVLASTLDQFDIPSWPVALILGVDWIMDMLRTLTNVMGNCLASVVMAKLENEFRTEEWERERRMLHGEDKISVIEGKMSHVSAVSAVEEGRY
eukprot:jgi/Phyca11/510113/fgenesh2_kg.PHYCAscaffold_54_\